MPVTAIGDVRNDAKVFVPFIPYIESEHLATKTEMLLKGTCSEEVIDAILNSARQTGYMFSPEAMAEAFPNILHSDQLNVGCSQPAIQMEFISVMSTNTAMVNKLYCDSTHAGLLCTPPVEDFRYFVGEPTKTIKLAASVSFDEALHIVEWYRHDAGEVLSERQKQQARNLSWRMAIDRDDSSYRVRIGDPYCECVLRLRLEGAGSLKRFMAINVIDEPKFDCSGRSVVQR